MAAAALLAAALGAAIGLVLGGLGGGGGVLAVPALVYLLGQTAQDATTGSLIIVGVTALAGTAARIRDRRVDWRTGLAFGAVGIPAAALGTALNRQVGRPVLLLAFAALAVLAAVAMLVHDRGARGPVEPPEDPPAGGSTATAVATRHGHRTATAATIAAGGGAVGVLTGFLGVGGGFLVVPALVIALRMPMTLAVGTSLLVIVLNAGASLAARAGDLPHLDWTAVAPFTVGAVLGGLVGQRLADRLSGTTLTRSFAVMLLAVGLAVGIESVVAL